MSDFKHTTLLIATPIDGKLHTTRYKKIGFLTGGTYPECDETVICPFDKPVLSISWKPVSDGVTQSPEYLYWSIVATLTNENQFGEKLQILNADDYIVFIKNDDFLYFVKTYFCHDSYEIKFEEGVPHSLFRDIADRTSSLPLMRACIYALTSVPASYEISPPREKRARDDSYTPSAIPSSSSSMPSARRNLLPTLLLADSSSPTIVATAINPTPGMRGCGRFVLPVERTFSDEELEQDLGLTRKLMFGVVSSSGYKIPYVFTHDDTTPTTMISFLQHLTAQYGTPDLVIYFNRDTHKFHACTFDILCQFRRETYKDMTMRATDNNQVFVAGRYSLLMSEWERCKEFCPM